jgi:hypothetical protein
MRTVPEQIAEEQDWVTRLFWLGSTPHPDPKKLEFNLRDSKPAKFFQNWFVPQQQSTTH